MIDKVRFSPSVLRGIRKLAIRAIGPKELASSVTEAYGSNAVETAMQISEELHGSAWMKDPGTDRKAVPRHNDPHSGRISKVRKDIEATVRLRNQFSSQKHQSISETVSKLPAAVHLEEKPPSATGDEAAPTGKAFESGNTNKDTYPPVPDDLEPGNVSNKCVVPPLGQRTRAEIVNKSDAEALSNKKSWIFGWWVGRSFSRSRRNDTFRTVIAFVSLIGGIFALGWANDTYSQYRKAEEFKEERANVGATATVAGSLWAGAVRSCGNVGILQVRDCATNPGPLLQEVAAKTVAEVAVQHVDDYMQKCERHFSSQYCLDLINRALAISLRTKKDVE
jgi:hypothetical protein